MSQSDDWVEILRYIVEHDVCSYCDEAVGEGEPFVFMMGPWRFCLSDSINAVHLKCAMSKSKTND